MSAAVPEQDLLLLGGGHAHLVALRRLAMRPPAGVRITLVNPDTHAAYSGMLPGLIAGHYRFEQAHIDLPRFCRWAGVRFIEARAMGLDPAARNVFLEGRPPLQYDLLSFDIGAQPAVAAVAGAAECAIAVKPVQSFWARWQQLQARLPAATKAAPQHWVVVGGGAGGLEITLALAHALRAQAVQLTLIAGATLLPGYLPAVRARARLALQQAGVQLREHVPVSAVEPDAVMLTDGQRLRSDATVWCTAAAPAAWLADTGLPLADDGFLAIDETLQIRGRPELFAAGDCATQSDQPWPKAGVYAVRQGPVLADNWRRALAGRALRRFVPQREFLSLLSLGERHALAQRGRWHMGGRLVWRWKDWIDRRFMQRFQQLPPPRTGAMPGPAMPAQAICGGCGGKLPAVTLSAALAELAARFPDTAPMPGSLDDAALVEMPAHRRQYQSTDSLRQLVDDPWLMGRIAALHALSDLFAMGARPHSALANLVLAHAAPALQGRDLRQLLGGALVELSRYQCRLLGGHTQEGAEQLTGFTVNGYLLQGERPLGKRGAQPGDQLLLCKPLGTGAVFAAHMQAAANGRDIAAAIAMMLQGNAEAARLARLHRATAATDVTGFGLLGHLLEMLGGGLAARLDASAVPVLPGALAAITSGYQSSMALHNRRFLDALAVSGADLEALEALLLDPQTAGGLLLASSPVVAEALLDDLRSAGYAEASIIGAVTASAGSGRAVQLSGRIGSG